MLQHQTNSVRVLLAAGVAATSLACSSPQSQDTSAQSPSVVSYAVAQRIREPGRHGFDLLLGDWRVHHRQLKPGTPEWVEFQGTCSNRTLMDGAANIEEHALEAPSGAYRTVALRSYDSKTDEWAIWWLDGRYPSGPLDPPMKGRFENGTGAFYAELTEDGKRMRGRFLWSNITPTSARFERAVSEDGGNTWTTNWIMEFRRAE
jgi:hypothetical protein